MRMMWRDRRLEWRETPASKLPHVNDALVRPIALSICDVDTDYLTGAFPTREEFCFGHELVADVMEIGAGMTTFVPGDSRRHVANAIVESVEEFGVECHYIAPGARRC